MTRTVGEPAAPINAVGSPRAARVRTFERLLGLAGGPVLRHSPGSVTPAPSRRALLYLGTGVLVATAVLLALNNGLTDLHDQYDLRIYFGSISWWEDGNGLYGYAIADPVMGRLGFTYPPFAAVLMAPLTAAGWRPMQGAAIVGILGAGAAMVHLCLGERVRVSGRHLWPVLTVATAAAFVLQPFRGTLAMGQINLFLAVLVLGDILVLGRRGSRWTGVGIGLAMAIKIVPGIFLVYLAATRRWRALAVAMVTCASCWLLGAVAAPSATWEYFSSLLWDTRRVGLPATATNQSLYGLLSRIAAPGQAHLSTLALLAVPVAVLAIRRLYRAGLAGDDLAAVTITGLLGILLCPVSWLHHCVWVLPALVIVGHRCLLVIGEQVRSGRFSWPRPALLAGLLLTGLLVLVPDTRGLFHLPFANPGALSPLQVAASSLPLAWMLVAMLTLPILPAAGADANSPPALRSSEWRRT